ncbi:MAG: hypothetical protein HKO59_02495 [Phycisphaerales bacterium]|nr:hypothetical protein [Phycisphaerales bacterium]
MRITHSSLLFATFGVAFLNTASPAAIAIEDIAAAERFTADFAGLEAGAQVPPGVLPGAAFKSPGTVMFLQNPSFYLVGSNRSWGVSGEAKAAVELKRPAKSITVAARGSADGDQTGPTLGGQRLSDAIGFVHVFDESGARLATEKIPNVSLRGDDAKLITFEDVGAIKTIVIENQAAAANAVLVVGGIGHTPRCIADADGDGMVGFSDLLAVLGGFGSTCLDCPGDVTGDGSVNFEDLLTVLSGFGKCPG